MTSSSSEWQDVYEKSCPSLEWEKVPQRYSCVHCGKPTSYRSLCQCNRQHGTPGTWVWICEGDSECHWCPACSERFSDIVTGSKSYLDNATATWDFEEGQSDKAECPSRPVEPRRREGMAKPHYFVLIDMKYVLVHYRWQPEDTVDDDHIKVRPQASEFIQFLLGQKMLQLGLMCTLTRENAAKVAKMLLKSATNTSWCHKKDSPELFNESDEDGPTVWLFDDTHCEHHPADKGVSGTPMHLKNLALVLSACEACEQLRTRPPQISPRLFSAETFLFVTYEDKDNIYMDKGSQENVLWIKWWHPSCDDDGELELVGHYINNMLDQKPAGDAGVQSYLKENNLNSLRKIDQKRRSAETGSLQKGVAPALSLSHFCWPPRGSGSVG